MGIIDPSKTVREERPTGISILRPSVANPDNLLLQTAIEASDESHLFDAIADDISVWEIRGALEKISALREIIEDAADRVGKPIVLNEFQVRRSYYRDCYTHDLHKPERDGALSANIITIQDPNLGQVRFLRQFMRHAICQRVIVLFTERNRIDDYVSDLGLDYESVDEDSAFMSRNRARKLHLVNQHDEDEIERVVTLALQEVA